jgi:uncharacterized protein YfdQ (DUF2303 family)
MSTDTEKENIAQTVARLTNNANAVRLPGSDENGVIAMPGDWALHDMEQYLPAPRRIDRNMPMATVTGFCDYVTAHALDKRTAVYVRADKATAVIDDIVPGANQPSWGDHKVSMALDTTEEWRAWRGNSGQFVPQREFVNFIQDRAGDIVQPDLADLVQQLQGVNAESTGSRRDATSHLSAEQKREQAIRITTDPPEYLELAMPILQCEPDQYTICRARLQVKLDDDGVKFVATVVNAPIVLDRRIRELVERLRTKIGKKVAVYF